MRNRFDGKGGKDSLTEIHVGGIYRGWEEDGEGHEDTYRTGTLGGALVGMSGDGWAIR